MTSIVQDVHSIIKISKSTYTDGEMVDTQNDDGITEDSEKVIVEFISPVNNLKYQIKSNKQLTDKQVRANKVIKVWINEHYPHKSLVVKESSGEFAADLVGKFFHPRTPENAKTLRLSEGFRIL